MIQLQRGLAVLFAATAFAQGPQPQQVLASGVTKGSARITWRSSFPTQHRVDYGTTPQLGKTFWPQDSGTTHALPLVGLQPETTYYFRACSLADTEYCSPVSTFTTLPNSGVAPPRPPRTVDTTLPAVNGTSTAVTKCADIQPAIAEAARSNGALTHEIVLPSGLTCEGQWTLPRRTGPNADGTGWILIRSASTSLPDPGTRAELTDSRFMPTLITNRVQARLLPYEPGECYYAGDFWWDDDASGPALYTCTSQTPKRYTKVAFQGMGSTLPGSCSVGAWYYLKDNSSFPHNQRAHWCVTPGQWRRVTFIGGGFYEEFAAITTEPEASRYRLIGIRLQPLPMPTGSPSLSLAFEGQGSFSFSRPYATGLGWADVLNQTDRTLGSFCGCLARTLKTNTNIVFDRMIFDGLGAPNKTPYAICSLDGAYMAVIDSFFNEINRHVPANSVKETDQAAIFITEGPGPVRIENNYFKNNIGLTIFAADDASTETSPDDVEIRRNVFYEDPLYNALDPNSNGRRYWRRNMIESKRGRRWVIEGNVFDGGWAGTTSGACLSFTPRPGSAMLETSLQISDVDIRSNTFKNCPDAITIAGLNDYYTAQLLITERVSVTNNLIVGTGRTATGVYNGWPWQKQSMGRNILTLYGMIDVTVANNTIHDAISIPDRTDLFFHRFDSSPGSALSLSRNVFYPSGSGCYDCGISSDEARGTVGLNASWTSWSASDNFIVGGPGTSQESYPSNNYVFGTASLLQLTAPERGDYSPQPGSPVAMANAGYDRAEIQRAMGEIGNPVAIQSGRTSVTLTYKAPTTSACRIEHAGTPDMAGAISVDDRDKTLARRVDVSSIPSDRVRYFRVRCTNSSPVIPVNLQ